MAKAIAHCTCSICGASFDRISTQRNRREADNYVAWAETHCTTCPACYRAQRQQDEAEQAAALKVELNLPEISAVSDKQRDYAERLRDRYIISHAKGLRDMARLYDDIAQPDAQADIQRAAAARGITAEQFVAEGIASLGYTTPALLLRSGNAAQIIDALK